MLTWTLLTKCFFCYKDLESLSSVHIKDVECRLCAATLFSGKRTKSLLFHVCCCGRLCSWCSLSSAEMLPVECSDATWERIASLVRTFFNGNILPFRRYQHWKLHIFTHGLDYYWVPVGKTVKGLIICTWNPPGGWAVDHPRTVLWLAATCWCHVTAPASAQTPSADLVGRGPADGSSRKAPHRWIRIFPIFRAELLERGRGWRCR
jgi:hypothetical protein